VEAFRAVMLTGTISAAASQLCITQPTLTVTLRRFEQQVGCVLFERVGGRLMPTEEARRMLVEVEKVHGQFGRMTQSLLAIAGGEGARLTFGASPSVLVDVIPRTLALLEERARQHGKPAMRYHCDSMGEGEIRDYLWFGRGAFVVSIATVRDPELQAHRIAAESLAVIMPRGHVLAGRSEIGIAELAADSVIGFEPETAHGRLIYRIPGCEKIEVKARVRVVDVAINLVRAGLGGAGVDGFSAEGARKMGLAASRLAGSPPVPLNVYRSRSQPRHRAFSDFLLALRASVGV